MIVAAVGFFGIADGWKIGGGDCGGLAVAGAGVPGLGLIGGANGVMVGGGNGLADGGSGLASGNK